MAAIHEHPQWEIIDARELANRWAVPETWVREQTRSRAADPLPHVRLGRYVRFEWGSPDLGEWWRRRRTRN
jgi:hypothetical protein